MTSRGSGTFILPDLAVHNVVQPRQQQTIPGDKESLEV